MERLELSQLIGMLREAAGEDPAADVDDSVLDQPFLDLGYDSLALLQTTGRVERDYDITLEDEELDLAETPRQYLELVNEVLVTRATA